MVHLMQAFLQSYPGVAGWYVYLEGPLPPNAAAQSFYIPNSWSFAGTAPLKSLI